MKSKNKGRKLPWILMFILLTIFFILLVIAFWRPVAEHFYPKKYGELVSKYAKQYEVPESLVDALILVESDFQKDAVSSTNDFGLMQMQESTFEEMRNRLGLLSEENNIFDPEQNISCGVYYLHYLYQLFGDWKVTLAAYNAGLGNVWQWLEQAEYSDDGIHLKDIPFPSTKKYVEKIWNAKSIYEKIYTYEVIAS